MAIVVPEDDGWRIPDELWERIVPLLPPRKPHPLGCHNPRVPDRAAMDAILFVLRAGCQWEALDYTGICKKSSAHRRFQEWEQAGVFAKLWKLGLQEYHHLRGIEWRWQAMDGAMTKAPLGGEKNRAKPHRSCEIGDQTQCPDRRAGRPLGGGRGRSEPTRLPVGGGHAEEYSRRAA